MKLIVAIGQIYDDSAINIPVPLIERYIECCGSYSSNSQKCGRDLPVSYWQIRKQVKWTNEQTTEPLITGLLLLFRLLNRSAELPNELVTVSDFLSRSRRRYCYAGSFANATPQQHYTTVCASILLLRQYCRAETSKNRKNYGVVNVISASRRSLLCWW